MTNSQLTPLLPHYVQKRLVHIIRQITRLQTPSLLLKRQPRALPRNRRTAIRRQRQRHTLVQIALVVPNLIEVRAPVSQQRAQASSQSIALATGALGAALAVGDERVRAVADVVLCALLDDRGATVGLGELFAQLFRVALCVDAHCVCQAAELDHVGREYAFFIPFDEVRARARKHETIRVEDEGDVLLAGFGDDARAGFEHAFVAAEAGADDDDVQAGEHGENLLGD